ILRLKNPSDILPRNDLGGLSGNAVKYGHSHAHAFEQLRGNHRTEQLSTPEVNDRHVEQGPPTRHLTLRHGIDKQYIPQPPFARAALEGRLGCPVPEQQDPDVSRVIPLLKRLCSIK